MFSQSMPGAFWLAWCFLTRSCPMHSSRDYGFLREKCRVSVVVLMRSDEAYSKRTVDENRISYLITKSITVMPVGCNVQGCFVSGVEGIETLFITVLQHRLGGISMVIL
ncbi:Uncharacterized protein Adt_44115 [Abeliophyllum distichum]|uniref:Secreted protein n=1 Tax=Abeliophyllum distichum TaxID=126358 RepID=A0ABD1P9X7_9LAMI